MTNYLITCASMSDADKLIKAFAKNNEYMKDYMKINISSRTIVIDEDVRLNFTSAANYKMAIRGFRGSEIDGARFEYLFCIKKHQISIPDVKTRLENISRPIDP